MPGKVYQLNVKGRAIDESGIPKRKVDAAFARFFGLEGDFNVYRSVHKAGTLDQALLLVPLETIEQLNEEGWPIVPGDLGENITTRGIPYDKMRPGSCYWIGGAVVEISKACTPCSTLYGLPYVGKEKGPQFLKTMLNRRGWYAYVLKEGTIRTSNPITELADFPTHEFL